MNAKPIIAIVGKTNVGKSTLFNRLIGTRKSIVSNEPGVTRDSVYGDASYNNKEFIVIDTGGFDIDKTKPMLSHIRDQINFAIDESDIIFVVFDGKENITKLDYEIVDLTRKCKKKIYYVVNKIDSKKAKDSINDFYELGIGDLYGISSEHGHGIDNLLDEITKNMPDTTLEEEPNVTKIAIVGKPNVGKSLLINKLIGKEKQIVTDVPGTTIDTVDVRLSKEGKEYILVDTAGIRKRGKINRKIEIFSVIKAFKAIEKCHIGILVIDAKEGPSDLDNKIASRIEQKRRGVIIAINKMDLIKTAPSTMGGEGRGEGEDVLVQNFKKNLKNKLKVIDFAKPVFISAKTGENIDSILKNIDQVRKNQFVEIETNRINKLIETLISKTVMPIVKNKALKIFYAVQTRTNPQEFTFFCNESFNIPENFQKYLINGIKEEFGIIGVPIRLHFRNS